MSEQTPKIGGPDSRKVYPRIPPMRYAFEGTCTVDAHADLQAQLAQAQEAARVATEDAERYRLALTEAVQVAKDVADAGVRTELRAHGISAGDYAAGRLADLLPTMEAALKSIRSGAGANGADGG